MMNQRLYKCQQELSVICIATAHCTLHTAQCSEQVILFGISNNAFLRYLMAGTLSYSLNKFNNIQVTVSIKYK